VYVVTAIIAAEAVLDMTGVGSAFIKISCRPVKIYTFLPFLP